MSIQKINPAMGGIAPGGLTGQVLVKLSDADYDVAWVTVSITPGGQQVTHLGAPVTHLGIPVTYTP